MSELSLNRKTIFAMVTGVIILIVMVWMFNPWKIMRVLVKTRPQLLALAIVVQLADLALWALRWRVVLTRAGIRAPFLLILLINNVSLLVNNITPSARSGGEPVRVYLLARLTQHRTRDVASSVVIDRFLDYFPLTGLLLLSLFLVIGTGEMGTVVLILIMGVSLLTVALIASLLLLGSKKYTLKVAQGSLKLLSRVSNRVREHQLEVNEWVKKFVTRFQGLLRDRYTLIWGTLVSTAVWGCEIFRTYLVFLSLGHPVTLPAIVVAFTVSMFIGVIPLLPGGLGLVEVSTASVYRLWGIDPGTSAAAVLLDRGISYWMVNIVGVVSMMFLPKLDREVSTCRTNSAKSRRS